eukprot:TRINITY_DN12551_c0_g1_i1.p1 TRINITY_DN12551_c0_g1~~TRINITY_DN12551_c0_g1_i1.p1  ORF type:complete len:379 (+),score=63.09 TRINITY_DN12551_c0_g1_i1:66-1202(+)
MALSAVLQADSSSEGSGRATVGSRVHRMIIFAREDDYLQRCDATIIDQKSATVVSFDESDDFDVDGFETFIPCKDESFQERHAVDCGFGSDELFDDLEGDPVEILKAMLKNDGDVATNETTWKFTRPVKPSVPKQESSFVRSFTPACKDGAFDECHAVGCAFGSDEIFDDSDGQPVEFLKSTKNLGDLGTKERNRKPTRPVKPSVPRQESTLVRSCVDACTMFPPCRDESFDECHGVDRASGSDESFDYSEGEPVAVLAAMMKNKGDVNTKKRTRKSRRPVKPSVASPESTFVRSCVDVFEMYPPCKDELFFERDAGDCTSPSDASFTCLEREPAEVLEAMMKNEGDGSAKPRNRKFGRPVKPSVPRPETTFIRSVTA